MRKTKVLVSLHTQDNDFQTAQALAAKEAAHKLEVDVEIVFADNNAVNQSTQILNSIQNPAESRPDAIVLEPVSGTALPQVARAACCCWYRLGGLESRSRLHAGASQGGHQAHVCG